MVIQRSLTRLCGLYTERTTAYVRLQDVATVEVRTKPLRWDVVGIAAAALWVVTFVITYAADR